MGMSEKIRILLVKKKLSAVQLAEMLGTSHQNIYNKLKRDNFSEKELNEIANLLNCEFIGNFKIKDTNEIV